MQFVPPKILTERLVLLIFNWIISNYFNYKRFFNAIDATKERKADKADEKEKSRETAANETSQSWRISSSSQFAENNYLQVSVKHQIRLVKSSLQ